MSRPGRIIEVPYVADSSRRFDRLSRLPWCVFLDSGWPGCTRGRYDILTADPYLTLTTHGETTVISGRDRRQVTAEDPFAVLRRELGPPIEPAGDLPFAGGAIGYFAYDLGRRIERLPVAATADITMPDMAIGLYDWAIVVDHEARQSWVVSGGRDAKAGDEWSNLIEVAHSETPVAFCPSFRVLSGVRANMTRDEYAERLARIKAYLRDGDVYQVNFAQRFSAAAEGDPWDAYKYLRLLNPAPYSAYMRIDDGAVLSSSPERFLRVREGRVETRPIKGTRPRSADHGRDRALIEELRASPKDRAENVMIVDLLRNDLGKTCRVGSVEVPMLFDVESYATVHHLVSTVTGRLAGDVHVIDLLRGCFPGGSITGAPKVRAMEIIEELEPHRRSVYCGAIGYLGYDGGMDTNIAIRTLVYNRGRMHCWAGGGIVMDSVTADEYQESFDKAAAMLKLFMHTEDRFVEP